MSEKKNNIGEKSFLGSGWSFPPRFSKIDNTVVMSVAEDDIRESLYILLSTVPGERIMQPQFGCWLKLQVFEQIDETSKTTIKNIIADAILFFESRINLEKISFDDSRKTEGLLRINIEYTTRATNSRSNMVYPFYLKEGNNLP